MKKIGDVTSTADKNGEWTNGNVAAGIAPTILEAGWLNSVQREILGVLVEAGIAQDKNNDNQLKDAIKKIISGGDYATKTEVNSKLAKDQNGADIPDKPKFIVNLGLEEWLKNQIEIPVGMFAAFPHRAIRLPPKWYSVNGDRFSVTSPQGKVLKGLSAEFKSDWGITESSGMINVPNIKQSDGRTAMLKPINGTSRQVGSVEQDMQRRLTGTFFSRPIYNAKGALGAVYKADGTFRTSQAAGDASTSPLMTNAATPEDISDTITFDSGRQVPTGSENTVLNVGVTLAIYLGV
ncbi:hypothetical protein [Morganella morganii]|uniref:hypothetical protein n=1 Tax=Morganella morganii TaxID=582 RepID=UPI0034DD587D